MMQKFATGKFAAAAILARPKKDAELSSQLLFGEPVTILEAGKHFAHIRCSDDEFEGYVRTDQLIGVDERTFRLQRDNPAFNLDLFSTILGEREGIPITFGARLPEYDGLRLTHGGKTFNYSGQAALSEDLRTDADLLIRFARKWLYAPGMRGGRTPVGVDASALIQLLYRLINVKLPRTAEAMAGSGRMVDFMVQAQVGDLAFFDNRKREINHVGILLPDSTILHVGDRVRIDAVDHFGIYNYELGRYTHRLRIAKRLLPDSDNTGILLSKQERIEEQAENQLAIF
ncbi:NlpC/P60 family protein [Lewinella sp. 4G2]|uniref:C40 family peptidase n=1 Tax=Lewinella sp. 4G2 TaxID=1803372 RepID=UPI0012FC3C47|nr:NlpC/P60 family protein [Lewinella sp. 4G2]